MCDAVAAAGRASRTVRSPSRATSALEITCPGPEAALALVSAARRLEIVAKAREVRGINRVVIRDGDAIGAMLTGWGARRAPGVRNAECAGGTSHATACELRRRQPAARPGPRGRRGAGQRAMDILGDDVPEHLKVAGDLRIANKLASLEELGAC